MKTAQETLTVSIDIKILHGVNQTDTTYGILSIIFLCYFKILDAHIL